VLAALAYRAGLTPNAVTGLSAVCTFTGLVLLATVPVSTGLGLVVSGSLVLGYALDSADGQLARLRGGGSPAGEWLDHMVDALKIAGLHMAVLVGLHGSGAVAEEWLLVPIAFNVVAVVHFFATLLNEAMRAKRGTTTRATPTAGRPSVLRSLLVVPTDFGLLCLLFLLWGLPGAFLPVYAALCAATGAYVAVASVHWFNEMRQLSQ
jgi:phosphatidylglycerophosphate synthase